MLAGADNVSIRQESVVVDGIDLPRYSFLEKAVLVELVVKVLRDLVILGRVRSAEGIKGKCEPFSEFLLQGVHLRAVFCDRQAGFVRSQLRRRAMLVRCANKQDLVPAGPLETGVGISRKHRANQIAQMLYTVDIRESRGNQVTSHWITGRDASPRRPTSLPNARKVICPHHIVKRSFWALARR